MVGFSYTPLNPAATVSPQEAQDGCFTIKGGPLLNFDDFLNYLETTGFNKLKSNALIDNICSSAQLRAFINQLVEQLSGGTVRIDRVSLGEEAVVLSFYDINFVVRITPKNKILNELLFNQIILPQVIRHHSLCIETETSDGRTSQPTVLSIVPRLTPKVDSGVALESVYSSIRRDHFDIKNEGILFTDLKFENLGYLSDRTPVVTDLGALRRIDGSMQYFEMVESRLENTLRLCNPTREIDRNLSWLSVNSEGDLVNKQDVLYGDPKLSPLNQILELCIDRFVNNPTFSR